MTANPARPPSPCSWTTLGHPSQPLCFMDPDVARPGSGLPGRTRAGVQCLERSPRTQAAGKSNSSERKTPKGREFKMTCEGDARDP